MVDVALIPELDDSEIAQLASLGARRAVKAGEYLYRAGDAGYDFYVVLAGSVEVVLDVPVVEDGSAGAPLNLCHVRG